MHVAQQLLAQARPHNILHFPVITYKRYICITIYFSHDNEYWGNHGAVISRLLRSTASTTHVRVTEGIQDKDQLLQKEQTPHGIGG